MRTEKDIKSAKPTKGTKQNKSARCHKVTGSPKLSEVIDASVQDFITKMKREVEEEREAKNEAYSFILSKGLFFDFKQFHENESRADHFKACREGLRFIVIKQCQN